MTHCLWKNRSQLSKPLDITFTWRATINKSSEEVLLWSKKDLSQTFRKPYSKIDIYPKRTAVTKELRRKLQSVNLNFLIILWKLILNHKWNANTHTWDNVYRSQSSWDFLTYIHRLHLSNISEQQNNILTYALSN